MKVIETTLEEVQKTKDYICNKCGKSLWHNTGYRTELLGLQGFADGCYELDHEDCNDNHHESYVTFDLCMHCVYELIQTFKHQPDYS